MIAFMDPSVCDMGDIVTETRFRSEPDRTSGDPSFIRVVEYENMNRLPATAWPDSEEQGDDEEDRIFLRAVQRRLAEDRDHELLER
jgi:hypothetical protein